MKSGSRPVKKHQDIIFWQKHSQSYEKSGFTLIQYCDRHQLNFHTFKSWRSKIRKNLPDRPNMIPAVVDSGILTEEPPYDEHSGSGLSLRFEDHFVVELSKSFDEPTLLRLIQLLEEA